MILLATVCVFAASLALVLAAGTMRQHMAHQAIAVRLARPALHTRVVASAQRDRRRSSIPVLDRILGTVRMGERIDRLVLHAGVTLRPGVLVLMSAVSGAIALLVGTLAFHSFLLAMLLTPLGVAAPWLWVMAKKHSRTEAFMREFPDALGLLVSALRAGLSFSAAMQIVAQESPEPIATEFAITVEEQALGLDLRESLERMCQRVDTLDLRFFATAVILQRETGGNLADVLGNTASLIRVIGDIRTMTAQGKLTGAILVALPVVMGLGMYLLAPDYFKPMLADSSGRAVLWLAAVMQLVGVWVCWRIVTIKV
jgi:tight adherence protein B